MSKDEAIKKAKKLVERCNECKLKQCENCEISWNDVKAIEKVLNYIEKLEGALVEKIKYCNELEEEYLFKNFKNKEK